MKTCTDCGAEVEADEMAKHMLDEHGVAYTIPDHVCSCGCEPCERTRKLMGEQA